LLSTGEEQIVVAAQAYSYMRQTHV